jgi:hypothetical protein
MDHEDYEGAVRKSSPKLGFFRVYLEGDKHVSGTMTSSSAAIGKKDGGIIDK